MAELPEEPLCFGFRQSSAGHFAPQKSQYRKFLYFFGSDLGKMRL
jgi:hypothetical protein